jgi:hypothetical protein
MFVLICSARSGSTTLGKLMGAHPDMGEVFQEPFRDIQPKTLDELREVLNGHWKKKGNRRARVSGLKVMRYNLDVSVFREWVLSENMPVVYLSRRYLLRAAVSGVLSRQVSGWQKKQLPKDYLTRLAGLGYMDVVYEDFFFNDGWKSLLPKIYQYLGHRPVINPQIVGLMNNERVNDERTYLNIPNVYEIERRCGNRKNGWLLNRYLPML